MADVQHIFIVGSKGIPGAYGGYETFVDKLTECHQGEGPERWCCCDNLCHREIS